MPAILWDNKLIWKSRKMNSHKINAASIINESVIDGINRGDERSFATLYNNYFTYLCTCAAGYIFDADVAKEIVNDVFVHIWDKHGRLEFPIHSYLLRCVQNGCLNYIRSLRSRERVLDEFKEELLLFQEEHCQSGETPLQLLEVEELKTQVYMAVSLLPERCRIVFEKYLYKNLSPQEIADECGLSVNTVRVQIKNAFDRLKKRLGPAIFILFLSLMEQ